MPATITVNDVYNELRKIEKRMITKEQLDMAIETIAILSNPNTIKQIKNSNSDIKSKKIKEIKSVKDLL